MKSVLIYNCNILDDRTKKGLTEIKPAALKFCYAVIKERELLELFIKICYNEIIKKKQGCIRVATIQKWGFGMSPLKKETEQKNIKAIKNVRAFVSGDGIVYAETLLNDLSHVKGLFSRTIKQDQWDWFTVYMYLDYPERKDVNTIVAVLSSLRKSLINHEEGEVKNSLEQLQQKRFVLYCDNYLNFDINAESRVEYLYILSRREEKDVLKIGMTTRNVQKRVNEINSATGIIYPFSARKVFKVRNSKLVEKDIHDLLSKYRIRQDREFFKIDYGQACTIIEEYLSRNNLYFYEE